MFSFLWQDAWEIKSVPEPGSSIWQIQCLPAVKSGQLARKNKEQFHITIINTE